MKRKLKKAFFWIFLGVVFVTVVFLLVVRAQVQEDLGLKINEIAFSMDSGIDWIEIYNPGIRSQSLDGLFLADDSDDLTRFEITEPLVIGPGDFLVIYCNEYEGDLEGTVMTNFRIAEGETVYLVDTDGTTVIDALVAVLGTNVTDATMGRYPDGANDFYMMADYTPGEANIRGESLEDLYFGEEIAYDEIFGYDKIHEIRFYITEEDLGEMASYMEGMGGEDPPYVAADMEFDGEMYEYVGIRYKGNSSLYGSDGAKKSLRVDINMYQDQTLLGIQEFVLNNNFRDASQLRETLGYELFSQIGSPACLTSFAEVYVNDEYAGLYTMVENVDNEYLERNFDNSDGFLFKFMQSGFTFEYLGDEVEAYSEYIELKRGDETLSWYALFGFLEFLNGEVDEDFGEEILEVFDVYTFLDQTALSVVVSHMDSYWAAGRNMYFYYDPADGRWKTLPWDLNEVFGNHKDYDSNLWWSVIDPISAASEEGMMRGQYFPEDMMGEGDFFDKPPPEDWIEDRKPLEDMDMLKMEGPPPDEGGLSSLDAVRPLFTQIMEVEEFRKYYLEQVIEYSSNIFTHENLDSLIDELFEFINDSVAMEDYEGMMFTYEQFVQSIEEDIESSGEMMEGGMMHGLKSFITNRLESIEQQLLDFHENKTPKS